MPDPLAMQLTTVLGPALRFRSMSAYEEMSSLFEFRVIAVSDDPAIHSDKLLATPAAVSFEFAPGKKRWFHGIVASFGTEGVDGSDFSYRLVLRPWLWLLTRSTDIRIFQDQTVKEIVADVFEPFPNQMVDEASGTYAPRKYCVQYRESDFNFISRLLEEEGIHYYFRHTEGGHQLVLSDPQGSIETFPDQDSVEYLHSAADAQQRSGLLQWRAQHEVQPGKFTLADYNFLTPATSLLTATVQTPRQHAEGGREIYDYPGLHLDKGAGDTRAQIRADESAGRYARFTGGGNAPGIAAGTRFTLAKHPRGDQNVEYLVLQTQIEMQIAGYQSSRGQTYFSCNLLAQPFAEPRRPDRRTAKPHVAGPQTALVVGTGGDGAIHTDEHGRIQAQFYWDRLGQKDGAKTCWLRVASPWAGNGWGQISLPRIGQEVVVAFLEGDPDQPLVVGSVHNAEQKTPYELPDNATVSTWKSRSKQGGANDFNELRFEDKPGDEYLLLHAQKDRLEFVEETLRSEIGKDEHRTVKNDRKEKIDGEHHVTVVKDVMYKFDKNFSVTTTEDIKLETKTQYSLKTTKDLSTESTTATSMKTGTAMHLKVGTNLGADAGQNVHIKGGMNVVIEAGMQLTIKAGGASVVLGPDGVSITGAMVKINSGGSPGSGAGASPVAPKEPVAPKDPEPPEDPLPHR